MCCCMGSVTTSGAGMKTDGASAVCLRDGTFAPPCVRWGRFGKASDEFIGTTSFLELQRTDLLYYKFRARASEISISGGSK